MSIKRRSSLTDLSEETILYDERIGEGSYGEVWSGLWCGSPVAAKRIHEKYFRKEYDQELRDYYVGELREEWKVLQKLVHPNIVRMYTVLFPPNKSPVIVMELMHCDLLKYIEKSTSTPKVSPSKGLSIALGVAEGLEYLHGLTPPVVHRDLATKNILLTVDGQPKIADLGVAKVFVSGKDDFATARPGTPLYAAPETYKNIKTNIAKYGVKVDIFSFGVVLLVIHVGHEPVYIPVSRPKDRDKITEVKRRQKDIQQINDGSIKQLVIECIQEKSSSRPDARKIVKELQKIKLESEGKEFQSDPSVTFEKASQQASYDYNFKVVLLGNRSVGKSCLFKLLQNPVYDISSTLQSMTMGIFPVNQWFKYNSKFVKMEIVDTSGEERFFALTASYYRDVDGVILVYDVSNKESFGNLPFWMNAINNYKTKDNIQMLLVGNKVDLRQNMSSEDMVTREGALKFAKEHEFFCMETSAKDIDSVMHMYRKMVEMLINAVSTSVEDVMVQLNEEARNTITLPLSPKKKVLNKINCSSCKTS